MVVGDTIVSVGKPTMKLDDKEVSNVYAWWKKKCVMCKVLQEAAVVRQCKDMGGGSAAC